MFTTPHVALMLERSVLELAKVANGDALLELTTTISGALAEPIAPIVNLNGTSKAQLIKGYTEVIRLLSDASDKMHAIYPHGRDFQTVEDGNVYRDAMAQHLKRLRLVDVVKTEYEAIGLKVIEQETYVERRAREKGDLG